MNNNLSVTMTTVNIEIEEAEAGAVEAVLPALPSEDTMAGKMVTESSGQATEMPAPDCSEGGGDEDTGAEVLKTVTEAQDLPGSTLDTAADTGVEEGSVQEPGARQQQRRSECGTQVQFLSYNI